MVSGIKSRSSQPVTVKCTDGGTSVIDPKHDNAKLTYYRTGLLQFKPHLNHVRYTTVANIMKELMSAGVIITKVVDIGCGDKSFLMHSLLTMPRLRNIVCLDKNLSILVREKLLFQAPSERRPEELQVQLLEADILKVIPEPMAEPDCVTLIEVIEHFPLSEVADLIRVVFGVLQPKIIIMTTPNSDFNLDFPLPEGKKFRHWDHKFEWSSKEFNRFCSRLTEIYRYKVAYDGVGLGKHGRHCTQIAVFANNDAIECIVPRKNQKFVIKQLLEVNNEQQKNVKPDETEAEKCIDEIIASLEKYDRPRISTITTDVVDTDAVSTRAMNRKSSSATDGASTPDTGISTMEGVSTGSDGVPTTGISTPTDGVYTPTDEDSSHMDEVSTRTEGVSSVDEVPTIEGLPSVAIGAPSSTNGVEAAPHSHYSSNFTLVQSLLYNNILTVLDNDLAYGVSSVVWCLNSKNKYYPFESKVLKHNTKWDHLMSYHETVKDGKIHTSTKCKTPIQLAKNIMHLTNENDGACSPEHRKCDFYCPKCPFVYISKVQLNGDETPCLITKSKWQTHIVYENSTRLWFSLRFLMRCLRFNEDQILRKVLQKQNYRREFIEEKIEYFSCVIDDDNEDDDNDEEIVLPEGEGETPAASSRSTSVVTIDDWNTEGSRGTSGTHTPDMPLFHIGDWESAEQKRFKAASLAAAAATVTTSTTSLAATVASDSIGPDATVVKTEPKAAPCSDPGKTSTASGSDPPTASTSASNALPTTNVTSTNKNANDRSITGKGKTQGQSKTRSQSDQKNKIKKSKSGGRKRK